MHAALTVYLGGLFRVPVAVVALRPLGEGEGARGDPKSFGGAAGGPKDIPALLGGRA